MQRKLVISTLLVFVLFFSFLTTQAYSYDHSGMKGKDGGFESKFLMKAYLILSSKEELGLSDEQVAEVKKIKINTKKGLITKKAEVDILAIDIKTKMMQDPIDVNAVNKLIDKKYDLKKDKAKSLVSACASMENVLTEDQKKKMKDICKSKMKNYMMDSKKKCRMMSGKM